MCLFGSENNTYSVEVKVGVLGVNVLAIKTGQFSSELLQGEKFNYFGLKVLFDNEPVVLQKNTEYYNNVTAKITGHDSTCGDNGYGTVTCSGYFWLFD